MVFFGLQGAEQVPLVFSFCLMYIGDASHFRFVYIWTPKSAIHNWIGLGGCTELIRVLDSVLYDVMQGTTG